MERPNIKGTYQLVRRELPDGTFQHPPVVKGMFTYTEEFRNFSVLWIDDDGKYYSECYVARYTLTDSEYKETSEYIINHDQIRRKDWRKDFSYDLSNNTASSQVSYDNGVISFALPQPFEKELSIILEFKGNELIATAEGLFIDYWEKVS